MLAEGIEDEHHLTIARARGATPGQGWLFGRPSPRPHASLPASELVLPAPARDTALDDSPFACLPGGTVLRR